MRNLSKLWYQDSDDHNPFLDPTMPDPLAGYWVPVVVEWSPLWAAPTTGVVGPDLIVVDIASPIRATIGVHDDGLAAARGGGSGGGGSSGGGGGLLTSYTSGAPGAYNVTIQFQGTWTADLQNVFVAAADRISAIIIGDVPDVRVRNGVVDDIRISAELKEIDGTGGVLGQAGPTSLRIGSYLPASATMQFDSADAQNFFNQGLFDEIVTHEMLHSIGFGSIWSYKGLTSDAGFIGPAAVAEYGRLIQAYADDHGGSTTLANGFTLWPGAVPLETTGGSGTAGSHWSEAVFNSELMTGYIDLAAVNGAVADPLSLLTVASLSDLGYVVSASPPVDAYYLV